MAHGSLFAIILLEIIPIIHITKAKTSEKISRIRVHVQYDPLQSLPFQQVKRKLQPSLCVDLVEEFLDDMRGEELEHTDVCRFVSDCREHGQGIVEWWGDSEGIEWVANLIT